MGNVYTVRYENITPAPRVTNRDRVELYGKSGLAAESNDYLLNKPKYGIITSENQNKYEEVGDGTFYICRLSKDEEDFFFSKYKKNGAWQYIGTRKNRVTANEKNYLAEIIEGKSFGDADMSRLLNAILPDAKKSADQPIYRFIAEGKNSEDIFYEDYRTDFNGVTEIIRYLFDGESLVKIISASYHKNAEGKIEGRRCIITVKEFTATPTKSLLTLPPELKDETKREKVQSN